jgi:hypothetical protein
MPKFGLKKSRLKKMRVQQVRSRQVKGLPKPKLKSLSVPKSILKTGQGPITTKPKFDKKFFQISAGKKW